VGIFYTSRVLCHRASKARKVVDRRAAIACNRVEEPLQIFLEQARRCFVGTIVGNQQWDITWLRKLLEEVLPQDTAFDVFEVEHVFPAIGRKFMLLNARRICRKDNQTEFILLAIEDTTEGRVREVL
jgi:hypothetical protein